jgi:hypothetical protein
MKKYYLESRKKETSLHSVKRRKANWIGHILCRNFLFKHVIEGKIEGNFEEQEDEEEDISSC